MPQPAPPVPQVPAGWRPDQADMDLWITDSFSFLAQPVLFRGRRVASQAINGPFINIIDLDTIDEDPYGGWSAGGTSSQPANSWLCPPGGAGWYEASISAFTSSQGSGSGNQTVPLLYLNGALYSYGGGDWAPSSAVSGSNGVIQVALQPGDYVQMGIFIQAATTTPTAAGQQPAIELAWVSS